MKIFNYKEHYHSNYDSLDKNYNAMIENNETNEIGQQNINNKSGKTKCNLLLDSGSGCTIINLTLAEHTMYNCEHAKMLRNHHWN